MPDKLTSLFPGQESLAKRSVPLCLCGHIPWFELLAVLLVLLASGCDRARAVQPRQPILFSHEIHAGQYKIECQYCHSGVRKGAVAGIPSVQLCMGCHKLVAATRPEIVRLRRYHESRQPIPWTRLNMVADFVQFKHEPHIRRGVQCRQCHGLIETMAEVKPAINLANMDFCVNCHRQNKASVDCLTCHY